MSVGIARRCGRCIQSCTSTGDHRGASGSRSTVCHRALTLDPLKAAYRNRNMHTGIAHLVATYGYWFLSVLVAIESFGIPLPGETALVTAAAYAAVGRLNIVLVIVAAVSGAIFGDNAGYWVGRKGGVALIRRYGAHVGLTEAKLERAHGFFERHGAKTVFLARFIALLRSWAAALAGVACMPYATF